MNWYDEKADNPPLARRGVPNCEMSRAVGPLRVARQHGPHWRRASGQPLSRRYCEVLTSTNRSSQRQAPPPANAIDGHRAEEWDHRSAFVLCFNGASPSIRVPPEALRRPRVFAGIGHIAGRARHSRSAASAGVRAFPDSILVEQRPIRFILE